jgi:hypothetical protein
LEENKTHNIQDLNQLFSDGKTADQELFSEMRSNVQLVAGEHYAKKGNRFWNRLRDSKDVSNEQKIRLTKNHIRKIVLKYRNSITSYCPGVRAKAKDPKSLQHQKVAELVNSVWEDGKETQDINGLINKWVHDFCSIGETWTKIFFDPSAGKFLGMEARMDENGQPELDELGKPVPSGIAKFSGAVVFERCFGFNMIRPSGIKDPEKSPWWCHQKMVQVKDLKALIDSSPNLDPNEKTKLKSKVTQTPDETYVILDGNSGQYKTVKDQAMLKEWFFKPCNQYPMGYFFICTNDDIIFEGELPFGIYPLVFEGFDEIQTSPRFRSVVKQLRPNQVEINRMSSKMAEHQVTLGDDKVLVQNGTKLEPGVALPGVRSLQYSGMAPIVMAGRTGEAYLPLIAAQIDEMYSISLVSEQDEEKQGQFDIYSSMMRSIKDKKKFSLYTDKIEGYLKRVFKTYIQLRQKYATPDTLVPAIGKSEYINIDEFMKVDNLCYSIAIDAQGEDGETKLGKQLALQHFIQYVGPQLAKDDLGKILRLMPYANDEKILEDLTMDYDFATNFMLSLERGKMPTQTNGGNPAYLIKKLTKRTTDPDYEFLDPYIQSLYQQAIQQQQQIKTDEEMKIKQAQSEFIPTGGYLVACDFYVPNKQDPNKLPKRIRIPSESVQWLITQLDTQGSDQQTLEGLNQTAQSDMADMFMQKLQAAGGMRQVSPIMNGQTSPQMGQTSPGIGMQHGRY